MVRVQLVSGDVSVMTVLSAKDPRLVFRTNLGLVPHSYNPCVGNRHADAMGYHQVNLVSVVKFRPERNPDLKIKRNST